MQKHVLGVRLGYSWSADGAMYSGDMLKEGTILREIDTYIALGGELTPPGILSGIDVRKKDQRFSD